MGQDTLKTALLLNALEPRVGGVLIRGEKGTAKSTAVRALAAVLPEADVVEGCRFSCDPADPGAWCTECRERRESGPLPKQRIRPGVVNLPVSCTEDRLVGTLDLEHALKHGAKVFEPGLLARANRSILYVDEVNLLDDHLVDTLLDAAAMGVNLVEREGVSFAHPSRFILVGTMNPEEGDVRPQLLDRFGLCVDVVGMRDPAARVEIVRRRRAYDDDSTDFTRTWMDAEDELRVRLKHARLRLPSVEVADEILLAVSTLCARMGVDGHRADLVMIRAATAHAALEGRNKVEAADLEVVAPLVLAHRVRTSPFERDGYDEGTLREALSSAIEEAAAAGAEDSESPGSGSGSQSVLLQGPETGSDDPSAELVEVDAGFTAQMDRARRAINGRRQESISSDGRGRYSRSEPARGSVADMALDATIRAAAPHQSRREGSLAINIEPSDVHTKVRTRKVGASIAFCVDASGSMGADDRMAAAKNAVLELLVEAYQRRDRVGLVAFRGDGAEVVLSPTASVELAQIKMRTLATGGATPLAAGLLASIEMLESEIRRDGDVIPWLVLVTDGRANVGLNGGLGSEDARVVATRIRAMRLNTLVLDSGGGTRPSVSAKEIATAAGAEYLRLGTLDGSSLAAAVRARIAG